MSPVFPPHSRRTTPSAFCYDLHRGPDAPFPGFPPVPAVLPSPGRPRLIQISNTTMKDAAPITMLVMSLTLLPGLSLANPLHSHQIEIAPSGVSPDQKCSVPARTDWLNSEKSAWTEICLGETVDFNVMLGEQLNPLDTEHDSKWSALRTITPTFLRTILLHEPYQSAIPYKGVSIIGAYFPDGIKLTDAQIERPLKLHHSRFTGPTLMDRSTTTSYISLEGSKFEDTLKMNNVFIGSSLFMQAASFNQVELKMARVAGSVSLADSTFSGELDLNSTWIAGSLFMQQSQYATVKLPGVTIDGQLSLNGSRFKKTADMTFVTIRRSLIAVGTQFDGVKMSGAEIGHYVTLLGATFAGKLDMNYTSIGGSLIMQRGTFADVELNTAKIGGHLSMNFSRFSGDLNLSLARVGNSAFLTGATFLKPMDLRYVTVASNMDLRAANIAELDLTGARVENELALASQNHDTVVLVATRRRSREIQSTKRPRGLSSGFQRFLARASGART